MAGNQTGKSLSTTATSAFADFSAAVGASDNDGTLDPKGAAVRKIQKKKKGKKSKGNKNYKANEGVINEEDERIEADIMIDQNEMAQEVQAPQIQGNMDKKQVRAAFLDRPPNQIVTLVKSQFGSQREPWLFFPYPPFLKIQRGLPRDATRIVQFS